MKVSNIELVDSYPSEQVIEYWFEMDVEGFAESEETELMEFGIIAGRLYDSEGHLVDGLNSDFIAIKREIIAKLGDEIGLSVMKSVLINSAGE